MTYVVEGQELESDDEGYLLEADPRQAVVSAIATAEGIELTAAHWDVIRYLQDTYRDSGHTPNFRTMLKDLMASNGAIDSNSLYALFPLGPAKQAVRIAGLPKPFGKGGY